MAKVSKLQDVTSAPNLSVIEELEVALDMAKSGELRSFAMVGALKGGRTYTTFVSSDIQQQIGEISFLLHTLCARQRENREEI
ncbi:MAG: hypothetical protein Tp118SUR00d2C21406231_72 [Prokaryotic dsDNA virus sp.]|nr:MAG: hypothetical protein Tp125DCM00d2C40298531_13 [Prokaryotic dsDNA virus sp.]QDP53192.1 MAG: hypothetical protein Tp118SUR00d2C21406231_72 [Prokaryotic dsDNA virus sp.]|tara:strand:+ start:37148 stop:37396 length:249 start_codon:yes stop_codon:yes gene_type:complete